MKPQIKHMYVFTTQVSTALASDAKPTTSRRGSGRAMTLREICRQAVEPRQGIRGFEQRLLEGELKWQDLDQPGRHPDGVVEGGLDTPVERHATQHALEQRHEGYVLGWQYHRRLAGQQ